MSTPHDADYRCLLLEEELNGRATALDMVLLVYCVTILFPLTDSII